jgi:hypothetical protein
VSQVWLFKAVLLTDIKEQSVLYFGATNMVSLKALDILCTSNAVLQAKSSVSRQRNKQQNIHDLK